MKIKEIIMEAVGAVNKLSKKRRYNKPGDFSKKFGYQLAVEPIQESERITVVSIKVKLHKKIKKLEQRIISDKNIEVVGNRKRHLDKSLNCNICIRRFKK